MFAVELVQSCGASLPVRIKLVENFLRFSVPEEIEPQVFEGTTEVSPGHSPAPVPIKYLKRSQSRRSWVTADAATATASLASISFVAAYELAEFGSDLPQDIPGAPFREYRSTIQVVSQRVSLIDRRDRGGWKKSIVALRLACL